MKRTWPDLPGVAVWPWPAGAALHVRITEDPGPAVDDAAVERRWEELRRENPKYYDAPLLSVTRVDAGREIVCRRGWYKHLAVRPPVDTGVEQLSVTGVVVGRAQGGIESVLLGRRGMRTRMYGGMWELGPSGGVEPPPGRASLCEGDLVGQLQREFEEETGSSARLRGVRVAAVCHDLVAHSYDVVFICEMPLRELTVGVDVLPDLWEYAGLRWVGVGNVRRFDRDNAAEIIGPTRGLLRFFGWA